MKIDYPVWPFNLFNVHLIFCSFLFLLFRFNRKIFLKSVTCFPQVFHIFLLVSNNELEHFQVRILYRGYLFSQKLHTHIFNSLVNTVRVIFIHCNKNSIQIHWYLIINFLLFFSFLCLVSKDSNKIVYILLSFVWVSLNSFLVSSIFCSVSFFVLSSFSILSSCSILMSLDSSWFRSFLFSILVLSWSMILLKLFSSSASSFVFLLRSSSQFAICAVSSWCCTLPWSISVLNFALVSTKCWIRLSIVHLRLSTSSCFHWIEFLNSKNK